MGEPKVGKEIKPGKNGQNAPPGGSEVPALVKRAVRYDKHRNKDNGGDWKRKK